MITTSEFRVSERVCLRPGTVFRARHGPQYRMADGSIVDMAAKGPFVFVNCHREGELVLLEAYDRNGQHTIMHIAGDRRSATEEIIPRPYQIVGTKRRNIRCSTQKKASVLKESHAKASASKRKRKRSKGGGTSALSTRKPKQRNLFANSTR